ncbi:PEP-CTERM sorting domain-containing protein [Cerasicoccus maritimus]|uniref:PEP-CTERM sorting domain-containing protein n=1 Tax=Cerasicoccus maritimus TaxID=490089 RepID=UPI00285261D8|nr:PEP-CTERM sorting domain-containing protein [Cerasicoccus maritimus]
MTSVASVSATMYNDDFTDGVNPTLFQSQQTVPATQGNVQYLETGAGLSVDTTPSFTESGTRGGTFVPFNGYGPLSQDWYVIAHAFIPSKTPFIPALENVSTLSSPRAPEVALSLGAINEQRQGIDDLGIEHTVNYNGSSTEYRRFSDLKLNGVNDASSTQTDTPGVDDVYLAITYDFATDTLTTLFSETGGAISGFTPDLVVTDLKQKFKQADGTTPLTDANVLLITLTGFTDVFVEGGSNEQYWVSFESDGLILVPEPSTYGMLTGLIALTGAALWRRRR